MSYQFSTQTVHFQGAIDAHNGAATTPIHYASTFHQKDVENGQQYDYTRSGNPTRDVLQQYAAQLEGGRFGLAFSSGMAAITTAFMIFSHGDHIICTEDVYGGTHRLLSNILPRFGLDVTFVSLADEEAVRAAIRPETKAIFIETPSNPLLTITDIRAIVAIAREHQLLTLADNTFMTPYLQRPLELGVDIVIHSATKFLSGHSDVVAGLTITNDEALQQRLYYLQNGMGNALGVQDCWLLMRGMKTLSVRLAAQQATAEKLAVWLSEHPAVENVYYPSLASHPCSDVHLRQALGGGAVLSFEVSSKERALHLFEQVKIPLVAVSLGAVESILSYPATMSHAAVPADVRQARGITDGLIRLSVGLESFDDLQADLAHALALAVTAQ